MLLLSFEKNIVLKAVGPILTEVHTIVRTSRVVGEGTFFEHVPSKNGHMS